MKGYFDEEEAAVEEPRRDAELTLGWGTLVGISLCLLAICGLCFGIGYSVGRHGAPAAAAAPHAAPTAAPDAEPLQANGSIPKPSASAQVPAEPPAASDDAPPAAAAANPGSAPATAGSQSQNAPPPSAPAGAGAGGAQPQVRPALPAMAPRAQAAPAATPNVRTALPSGPLMVQVAAVSHGEDAGVLVNALRQRGYAVTARRDPADGLIHVRVGPFGTREEANRWRDKLLGDGYNAMVQP